MIVKEGREYIVKNGLDNSLNKIKVYFDNDPTITTEDRKIDLEKSYYKYNNSPMMNKDEENTSYPLDIKFIINEVNVENLKIISYKAKEGGKIGKTENTIATGSSISISSLMLVIEDGGKNILLSRVVFPTRTLNGTTTALNFEYHLYF